MTNENHIWDPMSVENAVELMFGLDIPWWIAGGWAIDLFIGHQTRKHGDTDILIRRDDQLIVQEHLASKGLQLYKTQQPGLKPWPAGEFIDRPVDDVWCRWNSVDPWALQLMLLCTDGDEWVFKRDTSIRGPLNLLGRTSSTNIPYMRPHIQLLYKAKPVTLDKDQSDFDHAAHRMEREDQEWLLQQLKKRFGHDHPWLDEMNEIMAQP